MSYFQSDAFFPSAAAESQQIAFLLDLLHLPSGFQNPSLKHLSGGITNTVYLFDAPPKRYVVRVYGHNTDRIIDRHEEILHILQIKLMGLEATFANGLVVTYQEGTAAEPSMLADPQISDKIAVALAELHRVTLGNGSGNVKTNQLFTKMEHFLDGLDPTVDGVDVTEFREKVANLKAVLEKELEGEPILLCHNDLLSANIIWDSETQSAHIIDYEYCDWTWPQFDIANHFFEWVGYALELDRFPSIEQQKRFIRVYLRELYGKDPSDETVDDWQRKVALCVPASGLFWGSWGFFQAQNSEVDFPYFEYAKLRTMIAGQELPLPKGHELASRALLSF
jgi:ethanolamine kinase